MNAGVQISISHWKDVRSVSCYPFYNIENHNLFMPFRNELYPGLNRDYSILELADNIKNLNNNGTFQYMLDAYSRRHWGGIFEAPTSYRLDVVL